MRAPHSLYHQPRTSTLNPFFTGVQPMTFPPFCTLHLLASRFVLPFDEEEERHEASMSTKALNPQQALRQFTTTQLNPPRQVLLLRLRPAPSSAPPRHVTWEGEVRDNKGQRTSKKCCVFHKKRLFGESDSESSGSDDSDADDAGHDHHHHDGLCSHDHQGADGAGHKKPRPKCTKQACHCGTRFA